MRALLFYPLPMRILEPFNWWSIIIMHSDKQIVFDAKAQSINTRGEGKHGRKKNFTSKNQKCAMAFQVQ